MGCFSDSENQRGHELSAQFHMKSRVMKRARRSRESPPNPGFRKALQEAVDEGLSSIGETAKQQLYSYLDKRFRIKRQDIPKKIGEFAKAIEEILGCR